MSSEHELGHSLPFFLNCAQPTSNSLSPKTIAMSAMDIDEDEENQGSLKRTREPILDAAEMREEAERTRRKKRRVGAGN